MTVDGIMERFASMPQVLLLTLSFRRILPRQHGSFPRVFTRLERFQPLPVKRGPSEQQLTRTPCRQRRIGPMATGNDGSSTRASEQTLIVPRRLFTEEFLA